MERVADLPFIFSYGSCGSFADPHHAQEDHALFCFSIAFKDSCYKYQYNSFSKINGQANYEHFFTAMGNYKNQPMVVGGGQGKKVEIYQKDTWNLLDDYPFVDE